MWLKLLGKECLSLESACCKIHDEPQNKTRNQIFTGCKLVRIQLISVECIAASAPKHFSTC